MIDSLLTDDWLHSFASYHTLFLGFSGGLDSTVLLHSLASQPALVGKLQAVHIHHGLSVNAAAWQLHCQQVCDALTVPLIVRQVTFDCSANIEEGARNARYQAFSTLLQDNDCLLLAHHCDDQAETLLLQLFRGAGIDGLAAMAAVKTFAKGALVRPFLQHSRQALEDYARQHQLTWVEDESNQNSAFSRNYLRHNIMPLLQEKWPAVVSNLVRSAMHCQHAKQNLAALANIDCVPLGSPRDSLDLAPLQSLDHPRLVNVLRVWLQNNGVRLPSADVLNRLIDEVILASTDATPLVQWGDIVVRRYQQMLYVLRDDAPHYYLPKEWVNFPAALLLDRGDGPENCEPTPFSHNAIVDVGLDYLSASRDVEGLRVPEGSRVSVRFRQGGELFFWRGQTKQLKKLWQQWQVPPWQRGLVPLLYIDNELAAVVGFAISDHYFSQDSVNTYRIELKSCADSEIMV